MFYEPKKGHDLPHNPFNAIVTPRPIAWISTRSKDGQENLAPYSFFNAVAYFPPQVMFASTGSKEDRGDTKDTLANVRETGEFCINVVESAVRDVMNLTAGIWPKDDDEFTKAGIERDACKLIACSRVTKAPANLECTVVDIVDLRGQSNFLIIGEVVGVHMRDDCVVDGIFDVSTYQPLSRLGYRDYAVVNNKFTLARPGED